MSTVSLEELEQLAGKHSKRRASDVKANWRAIVEEAHAMGDVIVTNYNRPEVVVVSADHYAKLKRMALATESWPRFALERRQTSCVACSPRAPRSWRKPRTS